MRRIHVAIGLFTCLQLSAFASQRRPVKISIATPTPTIRSGATVRIDVTITNITDRVIEIQKSLGVEGDAEATNPVTAYDSEGNCFQCVVDDRSLVLNRYRSVQGNLSAISLF